MHKELKRYSAVAQGICALLHPYAEIAIHDLKTGRIAAIFNNYSKRKIGEKSHLEELEAFHELPDVFPVYSKVNWDGKRIKSTSVTIRDDKGRPVGLFCINIDLAKWEAFNHLLQDWIFPKDEQEKPNVLFKDDWREKVNLFVTVFLKKEGMTLEGLSKAKIKELIHDLQKEGAFNAKHAATYIAEVLGISRATLYNYLGHNKT